MGKYQNNDINSYWSFEVEIMCVLNRLPNLICPQCHGRLKEKTNQLTCIECNEVYPIKNDIPHMLDDGVEALAKEIAVQDRVAVEYEKMRYRDPYSSRYHHWWTSEMLKGLNVSGHVLDNGCGVGLLDGFITKNNLVGFDISSEMLLRASAYFPNLVLGNSQMLPFEDESFDLVICRSLLHHLQNPQTAVSEISRVLTRKGCITVADTNTSLLSYIPRILVKNGEHFSEDHKNMSLVQLKKIFEPHFLIFEIQYFGYIAYPLVGFPDLLNIFTYFPSKEFFFKALMGIDLLLAKLPIIRTQSWGIMIRAIKR